LIAKPSQHLIPRVGLISFVGWRVHSCLL
jgi:hypothetical protein